MKKIQTICILIGIAFLISGCENKDTTGLNILTTVYPISYITEQIYEPGKITSMYPDGAETENYQLTEKQTKEYSKANEVFIYNGLSKEQTTAKNLINTNRKLHIIDVAYGLKQENGIEELWLSPNYYLMLATTIKNNLQNLITNKYTTEEIENKYKDLEETLSLMDADLRTIAKNAQDKNKQTIVASSNMFKYLNNYGFNIISLEENQNAQNSIKNNFQNKNYTTILIKDTEEKSEFIASLEKEYGAKVITVNTMTTLTPEEKANNENYLTIMNNYLDNLKNAVLD